MKISVIIPCYRCEATIERCALSLFSQTYSDCEFLFVDDGGEVANLREVVSRDDRARLIVIPHGGASAARNAGIREAQGEYITFCDSDDYMGSLLLESYANMIKKDLPDLIFTDIVNHVGMEQRRILRPALANNEDYLCSLFEGTGLSGSQCDKCYKRVLLTQNGILFQEKADMWEDWRFNVEYVLRCNSIKKVDSDSEDACYHYVGTVGSLTMKKPTLQTGLAACENVRGIEEALRLSGKLTHGYVNCLYGGKILAKSYFLSVGTREALANYHKTFPEVNSVSLVLRLTRGKKLAYRIRHICAISHCFWIYKIMYTLTHLRH